MYQVSSVVNDFTTQIIHSRQSQYILDILYTIVRVPVNSDQVNSDQVNSDHF